MKLHGAWEIARWGCVQWWITGGERRYRDLGAVVAGKELSLFVALNLVVSSRTSVGDIGPTELGIRQWIKTKLGYVPADAKIVLELAQIRSRGELAIPDIGGRGAA